jgi:hypothetical protein
MNKKITIALVVLFAGFMADAARPNNVAEWFMNQRKEDLLRQQIIKTARYKSLKQFDRLLKVDERRLIGARAGVLGKMRTLQDKKYLCGQQLLIVLMKQKKLDSRLYRLANEKIKRQILWELRESEKKFMQSEAIRLFWVSKSLLLDAKALDGESADLMRENKRLEKDLLATSRLSLQLASKQNDVRNAIVSDMQELNAIQLQLLEITR